MATAGFTVLLSEIRRSWAVRTLRAAAGVKNMESPSASQEPRLPVPVQDEWGLFNPEEAGMAAVFRRIRELAVTEVTLPTRFRKARAKTPGGSRSR